MKKMIKKLVIILIMTCLVPFNYCFAGTEVDDVVNDGKDFIGAANEPSSVINSDGLVNFSGSVFNMVFAIGLVVAVSVGTVLGIKFMLSAVEEKAKIKEILTVYIAGCVVLFGAYTIWSIIVSIFGNI